MEGPTLLDIFLGLLPLLIILAIGYFFLRRMTKYQNDWSDSMKRQADAMERIAATLEKRNGG